VKRPVGISILGASGHGKVVASCLIAGRKEVRGFFDDDSLKWGQIILGLPVLGSIATCEAMGEGPAVFGIGRNQTRQEIDRIRPAQRWVPVIHPTTWVDPTVQIGEGTVVFAGVVVQPGAKIGRHCILNTGCSVDHDCILEDFVHLAPGVNLAGNVFIGEGAFLGIGAKAIPCARVGCWSQIGAGGVIVHDIPDCVLATGVPARIIKDRGKYDPR
jgi:sugar O-acyltransferase (sialic acid O-acetyltransferase NeuD family)